jgi:hypothetical protein
MKNAPRPTIEHRARFSWIRGPLALFPIAFGSLMAGAYFYTTCRHLTELAATQWLGLGLLARQLPDGNTHYVGACAVGSAPSFIHTFAFSIALGAIYPLRPAWWAASCLLWASINSVLEGSQRLHAVPLVGFGTFDVGDILGIWAGAGAAFLVLTLILRSRRSPCSGLEC